MAPLNRMPPIPDAEMTAAQRAAVADFKQTRNTSAFEGPFVPLLRSPELLRRAQRVGEYLRYHSTLPPRLREMAILIAARHWCQQFEWSIHSANATTAGLAPGVIEAIAEGRRPVDMAEDGTMIQVRVGGRPARATIRTEPVYDPEGKRLRE